MAKFFDMNINYLLQCIQCFKGNLALELQSPHDKLHCVFTTEYLL